MQSSNGPPSQYPQLTWTCKCTRDQRCKNTSIEISMFRKICSHLKFHACNSTKPTKEERKKEKFHTHRENWHRTAAHFKIDCIVSGKFAWSCPRWIVSKFLIQSRFRQSNNNDGEYDASDDISDDNGENDENSSLCECYNTWRRASNDGDDDEELHESTGSTAKKHNSFQNGPNNGTDSGCDSDCPENISELCKKFDENLSEQDVSQYWKWAIFNTSIFPLFFSLCVCFFLSWKTQHQRQQHNIALVFIFNLHFAHHISYFLEIFRRKIINCFANKSIILWQRTKFPAKILMLCLKIKPCLFSSFCAFHFYHLLWKCFN